MPEPRVDWTKRREAMPLGVGLYPHMRAARITNTSSQRLTYWAKTGMIDPHVHRRNGGPSVYAYSDLLAIRAVIRLRSAGLPLQKIRRAIEYLYSILGAESSWWELKMVVYEGDLMVAIPADQSPTAQDEIVAATRSGQKPLAELAFAQLASDLVSSEGSDKYPEIPEHVEIRAQVQGGAPVLKGTRIKTSTIHHWHTCGMSEPHIAAMYDGVTEVSVRAAVAYEEMLSQRN